MPYGLAQAQTRDSIAGDTKNVSAFFKSAPLMSKRWRRDRQVSQTGSCKAADGREGKRWRAFFFTLLRKHARTHTCARILSNQSFFKHSLAQWKEELRKQINKSIKGLFPLKAALQESLYILISTHYAVAVRL